MGINTNYVQIPSKNNPQRTLETLNSHLIETNMHTKTKDSSFVRTGHLAYLRLEGKAKKKNQNNPNNWSNILKMNRTKATIDFWAQTFRKFKLEQ